MTIIVVDQAKLDNNKILRLVKGDITESSAVTIILSSELDPLSKVS
jgi:hypothetical protein